MGVQWLKQNNKISFVEWCPTGFKIGNNVAVSRVFTERINKKYDMMYSQRAFVHWYVGEVWKRVSSLRPARTLASSRRTTLMWSRSKRPTKSTRMRSSKLTIFESACCLSYDWPTHNGTSTSICNIPTVLYCRHTAELIYVPFRF